MDWLSIGVVEGDEFAFPDGRLDGLHGFDNNCLSINLFAWGFQHKLDLDIIHVFGSRIVVTHVLSPFDHGG